VKRFVNTRRVNVIVGESQLLGRQSDSVKFLQGITHGIITTQANIFNQFADR
jgi:hypothetical protein